jgi:hypothetical protein
MPISGRLCTRVSRALPLQSVCARPPTQFAGQARCRLFSGLGHIGFFFYSGDGHEPAHVHVERDQAVAKFWLDPVHLARSGGYGRAELRKIGRLVSDHAEELPEAWNDYFST